MLLTGGVTLSRSNRSRERSQCSPLASGIDRDVAVAEWGGVELPSHEAFGWHRLSTHLVSRFIFNEREIASIVPAEA
jgi:hypothetical protein